MLAHLDSIYVTFKRPRSRVKVQGCHGYCTAWIVNFHNAGDIWWMRLNYIGNVLSLGISGWCNLKWVTAFLAWHPATKRVLKFLTAITSADAELGSANSHSDFLIFIKIISKIETALHQRVCISWTKNQLLYIHCLHVVLKLLIHQSIVSVVVVCLYCAGKRFKVVNYYQVLFFKFCVMQLLHVCCIQIFVLLWLVSFANVPSCHTSTMHFVANYFH